MLREGLDIDDVWVAEHFVPNIYTGFGAAVSKCLGLAFLWSCFDNKASKRWWLELEKVTKNFQKMTEKLPKSKQGRHRSEDMKVRAGDHNLPGLQCQIIQVYMARHQS